MCVKSYQFLYWANLPDNSRFSAHNPTCMHFLSGTNTLEHCSGNFDECLSFSLSIRFRTTFSVNPILSLLPFLFNFLSVGTETSTLFSSFPFSILSNFSFLPTFQFLSSFHISVLPTSFSFSFSFSIFLFPTSIMSLNPLADLINHEYLSQSGLDNL